MQEAGSDPRGRASAGEAARAVAAAEAIAAQLRAGQDEADARGTYAPAVHQALDQAGLYRLLVPRRFGGAECALATFYRVVIALARGHPGAAWCYALASASAFLVASHWPAQAQAEIFGTAGGFRAPHRAAALGKAVWNGHGFDLAGTWNYCSGVPYATHAVVNARVERDGRAAGVALVVVPRDAFEILPDWGGDAALGLQASGSNSIRIAGAAVPAHHAVPFQVLSGRPDEAANGTPGTRLHGNPIYLGRLMGPHNAPLVACVVGAAWAALDEAESHLRDLPSYADPSRRRSDDADFLRPFGQALAATEAAEAVLLAAGRRYGEACAAWARERRMLPAAEMVAIWAMTQQAGEMAAGAVELVFRSAGSFAARRGSRLQRYLRDVATYRTHMLAQTAPFATQLARARLGQEIGFG